MDEDDDGTELIFDEVWMQDVVDHWAKTYAEGVQVTRWYYDPHKQTLLIGLLTQAESTITDLQNLKHLGASIVHES